MKLSDWAGREGIRYLTAWRRWKQGRLPVPAHQTPAGSSLVELPAEMAAGRTVVDARVCAHDQRSDRERQGASVTAWATANGMAVNEGVTEVGSGLNGRRRRFQRLLADRCLTAMGVEHRDRLARFGVEPAEAALSVQGRRIVVVDPGEANDGRVRDRIEGLTSFGARLYGRRGARNRALRADHGEAERLMQVLQAYRFALDPSPRAVRALASHVGARRFAFSGRPGQVAEGDQPAHVCAAAVRDPALDRPHPGAPPPRPATVLRRLEARRP